MFDFVLPICAVHFRDEKCCCGPSAEGELGQWRWDEEWETWWWSGHLQKHGGLWGRGSERLWPSSLELRSNGISGWALLTSPVKSAPCRVEYGWWDVLVLMKNKTPQRWPGGRRDAAADLRSHSNFVAHSVNCNKNDCVSKLGKCAGAAGPAMVLQEHLN